MDARRARFPEAGIIADQDSLVDILGRIHDVIEQPQSDPGIPLDLRGTPYEVRAWSMPRNIPAGSTTSYGALAACVYRESKSGRSDDEVRPR
jgi:AraC family transcriptional regulator of adaptative response/methylated-DNA-[protein]-cysteine methyltransferase